jgi:hypothetical protein
MVFEALNAANVRYLVVGGLAVVAHGFLRATMDVDIVVQLEPANLQRALAVLDELRYRPRAPVPILDFADPAKRQMWIDEKNMTVFSLRSVDHPLTEIDLFVREPFDFDAAFSHRLTMDVVPGVPAFIVPLRELVQLKRAAARPKDLEDLRRLEHVAREREDD